MFKVGDRVRYILNIKRFDQFGKNFCLIRDINAKEIEDLNAYEEVTISEVHLDAFSWSQAFEKAYNGLKCDTSDIADGFYPIVRVGNGGYAPAACFELVESGAAGPIPCNCFAGDSFKLANFGCLKPGEHI